jgi:hypothetical protein
MSDTSAATDTDAPVPPEQVVSPVSTRAINWIGLGLFLLAIVIFYFLVTAWPVRECAEPAATCGPGTVFRPVNLFGWSHTWSPDRQLMFIVIMAGALGSLIHTMTSFGDYVGNRRLSSNWLWFLFLRIPIGITIALLFYFVVRGGILIPTVQVQPNAPDSALATASINPYAIAGFAALAGMFSKQATDKLAAIFEAAFAMKNPVERKDPLGSGAVPSIATTEPEQLTTTDTSVALIGTGFQAGSKITVNGKEREASSVEDQKIVVPLDAGDVAAPGELTIMVTNPDKRSAQVKIKVVA